MTYYLLLLPALAVAGLGWLVRRRYLLLSQVLMVGGALGCLAIMGWQARQSLFPPTEKMPNRAHAVVSFYLANQTQREIAGRTGVVVLIFPPAKQLNARLAEDYANAFSAPLLRGHPEWQVQSVTLEAPPKGQAVSLAEFQQAIARFPDALAYVSYASVPADIAELFPEGQPSPPFFVFDPDGTVNWLTALKQGRIRAVILPRSGVDPAKQAGIGGDPGAIFNQLYYLATPANADQIAATLGAPQP
ncbi:MAG: hypothetical protein KIS67_19630 [Verrucomicrobiae bacterium]|nr:hypothetical protein [Verrucomicrobiae bacterium]